MTERERGRVKNQQRIEFRIIIELNGISRRVRDMDRVNRGESIGIGIAWISGALRIEWYYTLGVRGRVKA